MGVRAPQRPIVPENVAMRRFVMCRIIVVFGCLFWALVGRAAGQPAVVDFASPFVPADHWSIDAVRRLAAFGLIGSTDYDRANRTPTLRQVARALAAAAAAADERAGSAAGSAASAHPAARADARTRSDAAPARTGVASRDAALRLARAYRDRFREEFPATTRALADSLRDGLRRLDGSVRAGLIVREGRVLAGAGYENDEDWSGPVALGDVQSAAVSTRLAAAFFPSLAVVVVPARDGERWTLAEGYATVVWRSLGIWAGRRTIGFSSAHSGGIVLDSRVPFDGAGIYLSDPVTLPWFLDVLGPIHLETFLTQVDESGPVDRPWMWSSRAALAPHPRLEIGIVRAAMFGGEGENALSLRNLAYVIIGKHAGAGSQFDNQIIALDVWYRPPLGDVPLTAYLQWGFEDSAGAWRDTPGIVAGVEVAGLPGLPELALGIERASFSASCCGNPIWYRHWWFDGGWTDGGVPLGHPLGGHGSEWLGWGRADLDAARIRLVGSLFLRDRGEENLFAPDRAGRSFGGAAGLALRLAPRFELDIHGAIETGADGWKESRAFAGGRIFF